MFGRLMVFKTAVKLQTGDGASFIFLNIVGIESVVARLKRTEYRNRKAY